MRSLRSELRAIAHEAYRRLSDLTLGTRILVVLVFVAAATTLITLLMRLYDPTQGEILIDGVEIRQLQLAMFKRNRRRSVMAEVKYDLIGACETVRRNDCFPERGQAIIGIDDVQVGVDRQYRQ